jgi:hypothetical protein
MIDFLCVGLYSMSYGHNIGCRVMDKVGKGFLEEA